MDWSMVIVMSQSIPHAPGQPTLRSSYGWRTWRPSLTFWWRRWRRGLPLQCALHFLSQEILIFTKVLPTPWGDMRYFMIWTVESSPGFRAMITTSSASDRVGVLLLLLSMVISQVSMGEDGAWSLAVTHSWDNILKRADARTVIFWKERTLGWQYFEKSGRSDGNILKRADARTVIFSNSADARTGIARAKDNLWDPADFHAYKHCLRTFFLR